MKGVTAAALIGGVPVAVNATQGQGRGQGGDPPGGPPGSDDGDDGDGGDGQAMEIPVAHPFVGDLDGDTLSGDMEFQVRNSYDGDPADGGDDRDWVLHYTTNGVETQDYPAALINLRERLEDPVMLDALESGDITFDYFVGKGHEQYIPGQVYLVAQTADQAERDVAWGIYRNVRKGEDKGWHTLDVVEEMSTDEPDADGRDPVWRALEIEVDPEGFRADFETFSDAILEQAVQTRDQTGDGTVASFPDVLEQLEGEDAELLAVGVGSGSSRSPTQRDIYYDDLRLTVDGEEHVFEFPAALQMDADFGGRGQITATLSLPTDQEEIDLDDVDEDSVRLYPYSQIMPPMGEGAEPSQVDVGDGEIEARFPPGRVRDLEGLGGGDQLVAVAGRFDYDHVVWFFGVGEASVGGD